MCVFECVCVCMCVCVCVCWCVCVSVCVYHSMCMCVHVRDGGSARTRLRCAMKHTHTHTRTHAHTHTHHTSPTQWKRTDGSENHTNAIVTSFNRNFARRNDGNPKTLNFLASPELVTAMAFAGKTTFNPATDELLGVCVCVVRARDCVCECVSVGVYG